MQLIPPSVFDLLSALGFRISPFGLSLTLQRPDYELPVAVRPPVCVAAGMTFGGLVTAGDEFVRLATEGLAGFVPLLPEPASGFPR